MNTFTLNNGIEIPCLGIGTYLLEPKDAENIRIMSWYPLGGKGMTAELLESSIIKDIAEKYDKSS